MAVWRLSVAEESHCEVFTRYGLMAVYPGWTGEWPADRDGLEPKDAQRLDRFQKAARGDLVILTSGCEAARAIGRISGPYAYSEVLSDVDGWELQHYRNVEWRRPRNGARIARGQAGEFKPAPPCDTAENAQELWDEGEPCVRPESLPAPGRLLDEEEIADALLNAGLAITRCTGFIYTLRSVTQLARWYQTSRGGGWRA